MRWPHGSRGWWGNNSSPSPKGRGNLRRPLPLRWRIPPPQVWRDQVPCPEELLPLGAQRLEIADHAAAVRAAALADHVPVRFLQRGRIVPADLLARRDGTHRDQYRATVGEAQPGIGRAAMVD